MTPKAPPYWRAVAAVLVVALGLTGALPARAADAVELSGRVFQADGTTPLQNATVRVINQDTGQIYQAGVTGADGMYSFEGLPAGTYTFEVEVPEGIYELDRAVQLGDADEASISFTVKPVPDIPADAPPEGMSKKKKGALIAIIAGGAVLLALALDDDDDDDASPFTP